MKVIIAEKAIAGRRIAAILAGKEVALQSVGKAQAFAFELQGVPHVVLPLRGHIVDVDFPKQYAYWLGTDLKKLAAADIEYVGTEHAIINALKKVAKGADEVIIATDADREGEAIGNEALSFIKEKNPKIAVKRAIFSAITPKDITGAFSKLSALDTALADSADARREIDLIWGAVLTRFISLVSGRLGKEFLSAGRVQTPVLAIIVDREKERRAFKSHRYWELLALFEKDAKQFEAAHKTGRFLKKAEAEAALAKRADTGTVMAVKSTKRTLAKPVPFNTTAFLRAATALGVSAGEAMNIAESLYQQGYTSYPRTDNSAYPKTIDLRAILNELRKSPELGNDAEKILALGTPKPSHGKETKDHPPIHPVTAVPKGKLGERQWKIYELIVRRFLATLSEDAETLNQTVDIEMNKEPFVARGQVITKPGWKEVYPYSVLKEVRLPALERGDVLKLLKLDMLEKETQPPARYSQGGLIKLMEQMGLGTKCLAADTQIKILNDSHQKNVKIGQLYSSLPQKEKTGGLGIALNDSKHCISFDGRKSAVSNFAFVSRRSLKSHEEMFLLRFADGSSVKVTGEHPFLTSSEKGLHYKPAAKLGVGDSTVVLDDSPHRNSGQKISWDYFSGRITKKSYLFSPDLGSKLKRKLISSGKSQRSFAAGLSCSQGNLSNYLRDRRPVPLWLAKKAALKPENISSLNFKGAILNPFPIAVDSALMRIIANLIADGSLDKKKVLSENCLDFRYHNTNLDLIERFCDDIHYKFAIRPKVFRRKRKRPHKDIFYVSVPAAIGRILVTIYPSLLKKQIPAPIPKGLYPDFIGAFFDDEGHAGKNEQKIFISGKNHRALKRIGNMLRELGITSSLEKKQHKLFVRGFHNLPLFLEKVPIHSVKKKQRIIDVLSKKYKYSSIAKPVLSFDKEILILLSSKKLTTLEIASALNCSASAVRSHLRRLLGKGFVSKHVFGNNKDVRRIISYSSAQFTDSFYALLSEKVLSPHLITRKIAGVEPVTYTDAVYDITNNPLTPNFVLGNGVIVHNSTRHEIIKKLYSRQYISGMKSLEPNTIGFAVIDVLEKYSKTVTEPKMTAELEKEMDLIANSKKGKPEVVGDSRKFLGEILEELVQNKDAIGSALRTALRKDAILSACPSCTGQMRIIMSRAGKRFLGCTNYPKCTTTFPLPPRGRIMPSENQCETCGRPMMKVFGQRYRYEMCIDHECPSKAEWAKKREEAVAAKAAKAAEAAEAKAAKAAVVAEAKTEKAEKAAGAKAKKGAEAKPPKPPKAKKGAAAKKPATKPTKAAEAKEDAKKQGAAKSGKETEKPHT